jgi:uncharacterized membrane protein
LSAFFSGVVPAPPIPQVVPLGFVKFVSVDKFGHGVGVGAGVFTAFIAEDEECAPDRMAAANRAMIVNVKVVLMVRALRRVWNRGLKKLLQEN